MLRTIALIATLAPLPALAQATIPVEDAPFKEASPLSSRLDPADLVDGDLYTLVPSDAVTGELLESSRVVDYAGNRIGDVAGIVGEGDTVVGIVLQVGGAFGVLDHPVAVPLDAMLVGRSEELGDSRIVVALTKSELESLPPYEGRDGG